MSVSHLGDSDCSERVWVLSYMTHIHIKQWLYTGMVITVKRVWKQVLQGFFGCFMVLIFCEKKPLWCSMCVGVKEREKEAAVCLTEQSGQVLFNLETCKWELKMRGISDVFYCIITPLIAVRYLYLLHSAAEFWTLIGHQEMINSL